MRDYKHYYKELRAMGYDKSTAIGMAKYQAKYDKKLQKKKIIKFKNKNFNEMRFLHLHHALVF